MTANPAPAESPAEPTIEGGAGLIDEGNLADAPDSIPSAEIMENAPEVSPQFDELEGIDRADTPKAEAKSKPAPAQGKNGGLVSPRGEPFDPDVHVTDKDGLPIINKNGSFRRKGGRPRKDGSPPKSAGSKVVTPGETAQAPVEPSPHDRAKATAVVVVTQIEVVGRLLGGDEWAFIKRDDLGIDERAQGVDAFTAYFEQEGIMDIPPGVALAMWGLAYAAPRFTMPKTKTRLALAKAWIANKFARFKGSKNGSRSDIGHDRERKNDAGDEAGE